jgi:hypothetical protein
MGSWTGLAPKDYWGRYNDTTGPTDPLLVQPISMKCAHGPQKDMLGPSFSVIIGTCDSHLGRDLNRPANKEYVFLSLRDMTQGANRMSALIGLLYKRVL